MTGTYLERFAGARRALAAMEAQTDRVRAVVDAVTGALAAGGTVYTAGNGGSAAEALHLAEELIGCYRSRERAPRRAVCLNADPTALTCIANDFGFEQVFARQCAALVDDGDALVVLSTSGNSLNLVRALETAGARGATTVGLLGRGGGSCAPLCDAAVIIDDDDSGHVQEAHLVLVHMICEAVERGQAG